MSVVAATTQPSGFQNSVSEESVEVQEPKKAPSSKWKRTATIRQIAMSMSRRGKRFSIIFSHNTKQKQFNFQFLCIHLCKKFICMHTTSHDNNVQFITQDAVSNFSLT